MVVYFSSFNDPLNIFTWRVGDVCSRTFVRGFLTNLGVSHVVLVIESKYAIRVSNDLKVVNMVSPSGNTKVRC